MPGVGSVIGYFLLLATALLLYRVYKRPEVDLLTLWQRRNIEMGAVAIFVWHSGVLWTTTSQDPLNTDIKFDRNVKRIFHGGAFLSVPPIVDRCATDIEKLDQNDGQIFMSFLCVPGFRQRKADPFSNVFEGLILAHLQMMI